jgi:hypothetical protein
VMLDKLGYGFFGLPKRLMRMRAEPVEAALASSSANTTGHDFVAVRRDIYAETARRLRAV